jgi:hypothetical protein
MRDDEAKVIEDGPERKRKTVNHGRRSDGPLKEGVAVGARVHQDTDANDKLDQSMLRCLILGIPDALIVAKNQAKYQRKKAGSSFLETAGDLEVIIKTPLGARDCERRKIRKRGVERREGDNGKRGGTQRDREREREGEGEGEREKS